MPRSLLFRQWIRMLQRARRAQRSREGRPAPVAAAGVRWTRRRFLRTLAIAGVASTGAGTLPLRAGAWGRRGAPPRRVAIVGGGLAGLSAAYRLSRAGVEATVYEARARLGGRVLTVADGLAPGLVTDLGGEFINSDHADLLGLVDELGLSLFDRAADAERLGLPPTGFFFDGVVRPEALVAEHLAPLAEQIAADADRLDADEVAVGRELDALSVAEYLDRHAERIPEPYVRALVEASIRTEYGVEPEESSALQLVFNLPTVDGLAVEVLGNSDERFVVQGGSGRIVAELAKRLAGRIRTRMPLVRLGTSGDGYRLEFANGGSERADLVLLAIPFSVLRDVVLDVPLPRRLSRFIRELELGRNEKVVAGFRERSWRRPEGFVTEAWTDLGFAEVWDASQRQAQRADGALTFFLGGREADGAAGRRARAVGREFVRRLDALLPGVEPVSADVFLRTRWSRERYTQGGYASFAPGQLTRFGGLQWFESDDPAERQEVRAGDVLFAGEQLSSAYYGFMNGAVETGRLAAETVLRARAEARRSGG